MADLLAVFGYLCLVLTFLAIAVPRFVGRTPNRAAVFSFGLATLVLAAIQDLALR